MSEVKENILLTKAEAIVLLKAGKKVSHEYFEPGEYFFEVEPGVYEFDDTYRVKEEMFWHDRNHAGWDDGWQEVIILNVNDFDTPIDEVDEGAPDDDTDDFEPCTNCDLPDACVDFGCAIKNGVKKDVPPW